MAAACIYTDSTVINYINEWGEIIQRDYNHPSIAAWVPFNESWAVPNIKNNILQQNHSVSLYYFIKSLDTSRLVINNNGWGYSNASNEAEFCSQYSFVIQNILDSDLIYGFCYTQLSDVEQETNGLLTYDRKPKCDPAVIRSINETYRHNISIS